MTQAVRCPCRGHPACKLCSGAGTYGYDPGPDGWHLFPCPTCRDAHTPDERRGCVTCRGRGLVDPANPPAEAGWRGALFEPGFGRWVVLVMAPIVAVAVLFWLVTLFS